jgi:hypothetical protein
MQRKLVLVVGLALIAMGVTDCTMKQNQEPQTMPVSYSTNIDVAEGSELYVADVLWQYETTYPVSFGNFDAKTIIVTHHVEDAFVYLVLDRVPKPEDFTLMLDPPVKGAKVVEILTRRRWPVPDPELPNDTITE